MPRRHLTATLLVLTAAASACGPIGSRSAIADARVALEAARVSDAGRFAQFEYTAAQEYLHKASEEMNYSEHSAAIDLAQIAATYAERARAKALGHPDRGPRTGPASEPPPAVAPAPLAPPPAEPPPPRPTTVPEPAGADW